jgi:hypothetical protein
VVSTLAYHLKNAEFILDMLCFAPDVVEGLITDAHRNLNLRMDPEKIVSTVKECSCVKTNEGFEACLNVNRENFLDGQKLGEDQRFDDILREIDGVFEAQKIDWAGKHLL